MAGTDPMLFSLTVVARLRRLDSHCATWVFIVIVRDGGVRWTGGVFKFFHDRCGLIRE